MIKECMNLALTVTFLSNFVKLSVDNSTAAKPLAIAYIQAYQRAVSCRFFAVEFHLRFILKHFFDKAFF